MGEDENQLRLEQRYQQATSERNNAVRWEKTKIGFYVVEELYKPDTSCLQQTNIGAEGVFKLARTHIQIVQ